MLMPWGKFRNKPIDSIHTSYLVWVLEETDIRDPHRSAILQTVAARLALPPTIITVPGPPRQPPAHLASEFAATLKAGFHARAFSEHPDRGGSDAAMQRVNALRAWCRQEGLF